MKIAKISDTDINGHESFTEIGDCRILLSNRSEVLPKIPLDLLGFVLWKRLVKFFLPTIGICRNEQIKISGC